LQRSDRRTLLVGRTDRATRERIARSAASAGSGIESLDDGPSALGWLEKGEPHAIVVHLLPDQAERFVVGVRAQPKLSRVPVLVLAEEIGDLTFAQAFAWGADDAVACTDETGMQRRLRSIPPDLPHEAPANRGRAVLAHPDQRARVLLARVLRNAGFDVHFAIRGEELEKAALQQGVVLVVTDCDLEGSRAPDVLRKVCNAGMSAPWVVMTPPKHMPALVDELAGQRRVVVHDSFAPYENLIFVANEILSGSFNEQRASPRLLYNTWVGFRAAGRDLDRNGYVYNISAHGLFVRTLDPLMRGEDVWIELTPPRTDRRVRLEGIVAWTRSLGPFAGATAPPGFGIQITGGSVRDLERFREGYAAFARDLAGRR